MHFTTLFTCHLLLCNIIKIQWLKNKNPLLSHGVSVRAACPGGSCEVAVRPLARCKVIRRLGGGEDAVSRGDLFLGLAGWCRLRKEASVLPHRDLSRGLIT